MSNAIAPQFISHDFPRFTAVIAQQTPEEALRCSTIPLCLQVDIDHLTVLIHSTPQVMLLAVYLHKDFIDVEGIAIASVFSLKSPCVQSTELDAPDSDRFTTDRDAPFCQQILNISMAEIESVVEPDGVGNDIGWGRLAGIGCAYMYSWANSIEISQLSCQYSSYCNIDLRQ